MSEARGEVLGKQRRNSDPGVVTIGDQPVLEADPFVKSCVIATAKKLNTVAKAMIALGHAPKWISADFVNYQRTPYNDKTYRIEPVNHMIWCDCEEEHCFLWTATLELIRLPGFSGLDETTPLRDLNPYIEEVHGQEAH